MKTHITMTGLVLAGTLGVGPAVLASQTGAAKQDKPVATQMDDGWITTKVKSQFVGVDVLEGSEIDVETNRGVVTLTGHVASAAAKTRAVALARKIDGVRSVSDKLTVKREADAMRSSDTTTRAKESGQRAGSTMNDGWITTKLKAKFVPDDALEGSDIEVDTTNGVVTLTGRVPTAVAQKRAVEIAKATEGVRQVVDKMTVRPATDTGQAVEDAAERTAERGERAAERIGDSVGDGWITAKVKSQFIGVDVLDGSDIAVDTANGVVTLTGTVKSQAAKARAEAIAKTIDGVKSVSNRLTVGARQ